MEKDILSHILLDYMIRNNLDKKQFAKLLGVSRQTLDNWLARDNETVATVFRMLEAIDVDVKELGMGTDIVIPQSLAKRLTSEDRLELMRLARLLAKKNQ